MTGLKSHDIDLIGSSFDAGIRFVTPAKTMVRDEILEFLGALYRAFPDWHYDHDPPEDCGEGSFRVVWRQGGTHTATLAFPGFDPVAATGRPVRIPEHPFYYRVGSGGLTEIRPAGPRGGSARDL